MSAIYRCHWHRGLGRAAGGREAPGVAQRPIDARHADGRNCTRLFDRAGSARPARRTAQPTLKQTRVALIPVARCFRAAPYGFAAKLLLADEGERGAELFILHDRGLRDLTNFIEGPIC